MAFSSRCLVSFLSPITQTKGQDHGRKKITSCYISEVHHQTIIQVHGLDTSSSYNLDDLHIKHMEKLKEARRILSDVAGPLECMAMIDVLQRLGIDYHFQEDIDRVLNCLYSKLGGGHGADGGLYDVALCFRLLRQHRYSVSTDMFTNFKDKVGGFKQRLSEDILGMRSLYEASFLGMEGEDLLDEAYDFASNHLKASMSLLGPSQASAVGHTLEHPFHRSLPWFMSRDDLKNSKGANGWTVFQELAYLDSKIMASLHLSELMEISKWWTGLGLAEDLPFMRDQPLKWYIWPMLMLSDPRFSEHRIELTKPIILVHIIDDIFDVCGTLDELALFTEAIKRWEISAVDQLPQYMKICFMALYNTTNQIAYKVLKKHGLDPIHSLRETWATLCDAFLVEAKWFGSGHLPNAAEYLKNGVVSSGVHTILIHLFFLLGHGITKESVDLVDTTAGLISSTATILRLYDDLRISKTTNGYDGSYVDCCMKENSNISLESAQQHVMKMISNEWKKLNKACLSPNPIPPSFIKATLDAARTVQMMYGYDDNHQLPALEEYISSLLKRFIT